MSSGEEEVKPEKKRPGRPRKYAPRPSKDRLGVVLEPTNADSSENIVNVMELMYDNPSMFKRVFAALNAMGVETLRVRFEEEGVKMVAEDHMKVNKIFIRIFGSRITRYYCKQAYEVGLDVNLYYKVFSTITQEYHDVFFSANRARQRSRMQIAFAIGGSKKSSVFALDVSEVPRYDWEIEGRLAEEDTYPIRFCLDTREFKKQVADGKTMTEVLRFEKKGNGPMRICYDVKGKRGRHYYNFVDQEEICLKSDIGPDDFVSTSMRVEYLKPLSTAMVADKIWLAVADMKDLISTFYLDPDMDGSSPRPDSHKCEIKVITKMSEVKDSE
jgi:hypothetical protein